MPSRTVNSPQLFRPASGPDFSIERDLYKEGHQAVCGIDEAGRGPLAGPVTAAAVILDRDNIPEGLHDSKKLTQARRESLFGDILASATVSVVSISAAKIDQINIRAASLLAMEMAAAGLAHAPDHALIDGNALPDNMPCPATPLVKGDARVLSISAASIIAKVVRDQMMIGADALFPGYGFAGHKGYPTAAHRNAVMELGPCPLHRRSFAPVAAALAEHYQEKPGAE